MCANQLNRCTLTQFISFDVELHYLHIFYAEFDPRASESVAVTRKEYLHS